MTKTPITKLVLALFSTYSQYAYHRSGLPSGAVALVEDDAEWELNPGSNGYFRHKPTGLTIQWGTFPLVGKGAEARVSFPTSFGRLFALTLGSEGTDECYAKILNKGTSGFTVRGVHSGGGGSSTEGTYIAIGMQY